ncbi:MAG: calcium/sodium antiporter [Candidatus Omnitrophica bacterium]|nr:calcium/sodium antiporter [Candidatus Omnitrophota bacterium]MCB9719969.1 calcium/sodium antiporter [Candidatus Omnitrophota bacterium]
MHSILTTVVGLVLLIQGASVLVDGASALAARCRVPPLVIGLTIVAFGTSMPELIVNILASAQGDTGLAVGNVIGSNIANTLLILGIAALIRPLNVADNTVSKELPLSLLAAFILFVQGNDRLLDGSAVSMISHVDGVVLLCFFVIFIYYLSGLLKESETAGEEQEAALPPIFRTVVGMAIGVAVLVGGGYMVVFGAVRLAMLMHVTETLVGLTVVAVGTSLPELATSVVAAHKGNADIAIGNVIGSNIFNIFFILGVSAIIAPLPFDWFQSMDTLILFAAGVLLLVCTRSGGRSQINRGVGGVLVLCYTLYLGYAVLRG